MIDDSVLEILCNPINQEKLKCKSQFCDHLVDSQNIEFPVKNGIPVLLPPEENDKGFELEDYWKNEYNKRAQVSDAKDYTISGWSEYGFERRFRAFHDFYQPLLNERADIKYILDMGCGPGSYLHRINKSTSSNLIGVDFSYNILRFAQEKFHLNNLICADGRFLPFDSQSIDMVYSIGLFQQLSKQEILLDSVYRILNNNGVLFLITMSETFKIKKLYKVQSFGKDHNPVGNKEVIKMIKKSGFRSVKVKPLFLLPKLLRSFDFLNDASVLYPYLWYFAHDIIIIAQK